jgi:predicted dehydrogenase
MIAVVGLGDWGSRHVATLRELLGTAGMVGVDPSPERREAAEALGIRAVPHVDLLPDGVVGAVVATPSPSHHQVGACLLERGLHLLVEKPLAESVEDAGGLVELARARGRVLMVGHVFLFQRAHERLRERLAAFGPVRLLAISRRTPGLVKPESGAWTELAPHELAVAVDLGMLRGPVRSSAFLPWSVTGIGREDGAVGRLRTDGGTVEIACSWLSAVRSRQVWAVAEDGQAMLVDDGHAQALAVWPGRPTWTRGRPAEPEWEDLSGPPPLRRELEAFIGAVLDGGRVPSDGALGLRVVEMLNHVAAHDRGEVL